MGGISGVAGGYAGKFASKLSSFAINDIASPVLRGTVGGVIGGGAGGYAGGFTAGLVTTGDLKKAHQAGVGGLKSGAFIGGVTGTFAGYKNARDNNLNLWTGKSLRTIQPKYNTQDLIDAFGLSKSIERINNGEGFSHRNDGSIFNNREGFLPLQERGYYNEYVHPTSGIKGPGPQRIIYGKGGDIFFTPDHYKTFFRIK